MHKTIVALIAILTAAPAFGLNPWPSQNPEGLPAPATPQAAPPPFQPTPPPPGMPMGAQANANNLPQFLQQLNSSPGLLGGFGSFPGFGTGIDASGYPFVPQVPGSGKLEACGLISQASQVAKARDEAIKFRNECAIAQRGDNQKIAVNDFSSGNTPYMYIFNVKGECLYKTAVSYGNGAGPVRPLPCSRDGSKLTPPGMHITAPHRNGTTYNEGNSTLMVGLEGQQSAGRGILVHYAQSPGTASSWGCSGVGPYDQVRKVLGYGSLVYNYFGDTPLAPGCGNGAGMGPPKPASCRMDAAATPVPTFSTSESPGTVK
jgi:hypothetical protein